MNIIYNIFLNITRVAGAVTCLGAFEVMQHESVTRVSSGGTNGGV
jgi:hypothetical protein